MENLALAVAMRSVGRAPRAAVLLFAPPAVAAAVEGSPAAAALAVVVYSQSPLDFGLVAADTWNWETAENLTALPIGSVARFPGLDLTWERTSG